MFPRSALVSPPFPMDDVVLGPALHEQHYPAAASNGRDYLAAWVTHGLTATRISRTGEVLDLFGFSISGNLTSNEIPVIASNGSNYFVVWI